MSREKEIAQLKTTLSLDTGDFKKELTSVSKQTTGLKRSFDIANKAIENAEDKVEATSKAISRGEKAMDSMNKKLELQVKAYNKLKSTVDQQSKSYEELSQDLNKAEKELEEMEQAENKNVDAINKHKSAIEGLKNKLNDKAQLLDKNINNLQKYSNSIDKTENDITSLGSQLGKLRNNLNETANATDDVSEATSNSGLDKFKEMAQQAGIDLSLLEMGAKGAAIAIAAVVTQKVIEAAGSYDKAITDLQITMGVTEEAAVDLYGKINDIADGGYSIEGITSAVKMLEQRFDLTASETEDLAQGMDLLNKYGYENKDVIRFMTSAVNDWGMNYEQALDYILTGEQKGLNISEDWMDTLVEYTPILATLGIKGEDAFALISSGVQATGLDTDKAADMVKEFFLTLTDGSTTSKDAFKEIGLNIDDLNKQIDSGSITSAEAMQKVMKAITEVGSETEQARILQEIFKGTIEYGSIEVVEAWANMEQGVVDTTGAIDGAKEAYEGSYEAMKQDLTQSWDELTQTIGSAVLPSLLDIVQSLLKIPFNMELAGTQMSLAWGWTVAQLSNAWLGFVGVCHEGIISILTAMQSSASAMGMDGVAESLGTNIDIIKGKHDELVGKIKTNEETIKNNSDILGQLWNNSWSGTLEENKTTFRTIMGEIETDAKKTNTNVGTSIDGASKKISTSTGKAKTDAKKNFKDINQSAKSELDGVKGSVDSNMDGSAKKVQQEATNMYKGVKTSFNKMNQCAREDGTKMYQGVTTSANKMASNAKTAATNMYKGVTGSTSKMAQKAISDWNRVRDAFSKSISGTIKTTKKTIISKPEKEEKTSIYDGYIQNVDTSRYNLDGAYYKDTSLESKAISQHLRINNDSSILNGTIKELNKLSNDLGKNNSKEDIKLYLELPIIADGREFARISAKYMDGELKIINNRENRKRGV